MRFLGSATAFLQDARLRGDILFSTEAIIAVQFRPSFKK